MTILSLESFLHEHNCQVFEGHTGEVPYQKQRLQQLVQDEKIEYVLEIGMNAGHSACLFLGTNPNCKVLSFDIGHHDYTYQAKRYIDQMYPNRHTLIIGDSRETVPRFEEQIVTLYDLIFIDGGHDYETALQDLINCRSYAHPKTLVIMDDTINIRQEMCGYNVGPTKAWRKMKQDNFIDEKESITFRRGIGMSIGYYIFT